MQARVLKPPCPEPRLTHGALLAAGGCLPKHAPRTLAGNYEDALRCLKNPAAQNLETLAQAVQTLLLMNRPDVALKELKLMEVPHPFPYFVALPSPPLPPVPHPPPKAALLCARM